MCNTSKKFSEKTSFNFEIILEVFFQKKCFFVSQSSRKKLERNIFEGQVGKMSERVKSLV